MATPNEAGQWAEAAEIAHILEDYHTIAVVGLSADPGRPSHQVARYLKEHGYRIVPVNPGESEILGEKSYPRLKAIPFPVEVVDIFRQPEAIPAIVTEAIEVRAKAVWLQLGLVVPEAARRAREAGLRVVMDRCMKVEHAALKSR